MSRKDYYEEALSDSLEQAGIEIPPREQIEKAAECLIGWIESERYAFPPAENPLRGELREMEKRIQRQKEEFEQTRREDDEAQRRIVDRYQSRIYYLEGQLMEKDR